jgi:hypothetical protein
VKRRDHGASEGDSAGFRERSNEARITIVNGGVVAVAPDECVTFGADGEASVTWNYATLLNAAFLIVPGLPNDLPTMSRKPRRLRKTVL